MFSTRSKDIGAQLPGYPGSVCDHILMRLRPDPKTSRSICHFPSLCVFLLFFIPSEKWFFTFPFRISLVSGSCDREEPPIVQEKGEEKHGSKEQIPHTTSHIHGNQSEYFIFWFAISSHFVFLCLISKIADDRFAETL